ncbi:MAG TPA: LacI family transcriptional regulator [Firmicutes bacterium]|nr:LacI family transcriptional regulator [Bacillota bacterium]
MANIKDVAKLANVSVATVSRVINSKGYVNEHTKELVLKAIDELNYVPNEIARSLYRKSSKIIGVIIPDLKNEFFNDMIEGMEEVILQNGYKTMLCTSKENIEREKEYLQIFLTNKIDGLILCSNSPDIASFINLDIPIVSLDRIISKDIPSVTSDNYMGGILAANRLIAAGCKNVVQFRGPSTVAPANERCNAFLETMNKDLSVRVHTLELEFNENDNYEIYKFLITHPQIDGIFTASDVIAAQCIRNLKKLGRSVPNDVQIIGYDNISLCELTDPTITTIAQPITSMGQIAAETLFKLINQEDIEQRHISLPVELIERESTK